jgi:hypothetical protein
VLLKIHLAPIREKKYKYCVKNKIDERQKKQESKEDSVPDTAPVQAFSLINKSKNRRRNIFVRQKKEIQKLQGRLNTSNVQVDEYGDPMDVDEEASASNKPNNKSPEIELEIQAEASTKARDNLLRMEDETTDDMTDATSRRMGSLKTVIIGILYNNNRLMIKERHLKEKCSDIQPKEIAACLLICNLLMPYIPDKKIQYLMPYQIPFVLVANEILRCTGYAKFIVKRVPLTKPSHINTLKIDAPSLFSIMA